jgi:hypothetical protein
MIVMNLHHRLLLSFMNGPMMLCAMICWIWTEINIYMRCDILLFFPYIVDKTYIWLLLIEIEIILGCQQNRRST